MVYLCESLLDKNAVQMNRILFDSRHWDKPSYQKVICKRCTSSVQISITVILPVVLTFHIGFAFRMPIIVVWTLTRIPHFLLCMMVTEVRTNYVMS